MTDDVARAQARLRAMEALIKAQGIVQNPLFMKDSGYQGQMAARFGVKFIF